MKSHQTPSFYGHANVVTHLMTQIEKNTLPHGLLFQGPKGVGKATLAYHLSRYLLSPQKTGFPVSETDPIFSAVSQMRHPDFLLLGDDSPHREDGKSEITIDEVRQVSRFLHLSPQEGGWRVVLIDAVDDLNRKAMNALLKVLEEPPARTVMILISHFSGGLLPTIRSRCQRIVFHPLEREASETVIRHLFPDLSEEDLSFYSLFSEGCPGRAPSLHHLGGRAFYLKFLELLEDLSQGRFMKGFSFLETLGETSEFLTPAQTQRTFIELLSSWIHRMIQAERTPLLSEEENVMKALRSKHSLTTWLDIWSAMNSLRRETEVLHLNRKSAFLTLFGWISGHVPLTEFRETA